MPDSIQTRRGKTSKPRTHQNTAYRLKITLIDSPVPIWRRVLVGTTVPLGLVHEVFQVVMGWWNCHLHDFAAHQRHFGDIGTADGDKTVEDENKFFLPELVKSPGEHFIYDYDFGDSWRHEVVVEEIIATEGRVLAYCMGGKRACPPEDVGGVEGYKRFLDIIEDPFHHEHAEYLSWVGGSFDADAFDIRGVNLRLELLVQELDRVYDQMFGAEHGRTK